MSKVSAGLVGLSLFVAASAQEPIKFNVPGVSSPAPQPAAPAAQAPAPQAPAQFTNAQIAEAFGWYLSAQAGLRQLEFSKAEVEAVARGLVASVTATAPAFDAQQIGPELEKFLAAKQEALLTKIRYANQADGLTFFTKLKENKNVVELPSGLRYEITKAGSGPNPKIGQVVTAHFTGSFVNGQMFATSLQPREEGGKAEPGEILLDPARAMPGLVEGLQKFPVGTKGKLYVPPSLAYGDSGDGRGIPPGATLVFDIEVFGVKDAPKEAAPAGK